MALRKSERCPFCKRPIPLRPRQHIAIVEPNAIRCQECDCVCLLSQNYCEICGWKTPTGDRNYERAIINREKQKHQEEILILSSCSVEMAQQQQQQEQQQERLNQREQFLVRERQRQQRAEELLNQQRQQLQAQREQLREELLLRDDDAAANIIQNIDLRNEDVDDDMEESEQ